MKRSDDITPSGVRFLREEQRWRRRMIERTWWAVLATALCVVFMLVSASVPSADDVLRGIVPAIIGYVVGAKIEQRQIKKQASEESEE